MEATLWERRKWRRALEGRGGLAAGGVFETAAAEVRTCH